ncbi:MAG: formylglycine-generating enzyme family protein [Chryseolinea sp.]
MRLNPVTYFFCMLLWLAWVDAIAQQTITNSIGMEFVSIPAGSFTSGAFNPPYPVPEDTVKGASRPFNMYMGDGRSYNAAEFALARTLAKRDQRKGFVVKIKRTFYLGRYEVTQQQWKAVMGNNPSTFSNDGENHPVENISWNDAQAFIMKLNKLESKYKYRLPTEFEWEYAARAGARDDIPWSIIEKAANLNKSHTIAVGQKQPNAWGLYDMLGNVWEWVNDYYNEKMFADPLSSRRGNEHVLKGASFVGDVKNATYMTHAGGPGNGWDVGFRIVLEQK